MKTIVALKGNRTSVSWNYVMDNRGVYIPVGWEGDTRLISLGDGVVLFAQTNDAVQVAIGWEDAKFHETSEPVVVTFNA